LELPPVFVLAVLWTVGVTMLGSVTVVLYSTGWVLDQLVAGSV
jgi:hypothetical protein